MAATEIAFFTERLALKEQELGEIKSEFHKYKLKQKVKYDNLRKEIASYGNSTDAKENAGLLAIRVAELETELEEARSHSESLYGELAKRQTQLDDHMILIKNFENQLKEMTPVEKIDKKSQLVDVESVKQQMMLKDQRILELINEVIEKSQKISELQEMYREKEKVAESKTKAMKIVQKKFEEIESRETKEVGTETDPWPTMRQKERETPRGASRSLSPGHAVVSRGAGGHSPPPLDPQDGDLDDDILPGPSGFYGKNLDEEVTLRRKQRKRVTFDLPPSASTSMMNLTSDAVVYDQLVENITRLSEENARLMADLEKTNMALSVKETHLEENKMETEKLLRDTDILSVKARAAHRRIKDFEMSLEMKEREHTVELGRLKVEIDTLRSTREWEVEQNARLRDQLDQLREKNMKLTEELTSNGEVNRNLESKLEKAQSLLENITTDLEEAETLVVFMEDEKQSILDDVEKMKEAILAQDQFISLLEADIVIYEEHVGLLRDSLGASKVDHRSLLRSKAFETKLRALEQEKEQITIKSREEKQRTKALAEKVKTLEEENERLMRKECDREMQAAEEAEMAETCRQLEARLRETDERMRLERTQFEIELEASRVENKQRNIELEELNFQLNVLRRQEENLQQTVAVQETSEREELRGKVESQETKIQELSEQISSLERELDNARGLNFELQGQLKETEELEKDYDELVEKHRQACIDLVASKEKIQQLEEVTATIPELEEAKKYAEEQVEQLERDKRVMRVEVEAARTTFTETAAVKKELEYLQAELEREKVIGQQKWEEFCKKALEGGISEPGSRKSSMEIQREQYIIAFEEKIEKLEEELLLTKTKLASEEQQKHELQRKIEEKQEVANVQSAEEGKNVISEEIQKELEEMKQREDVLRNKIRDLELENSLAAELGVEMGRVIQTYEHQIKSQEQIVAEANERSHSATMELRLHEMLNEELGAELDQLKIAQTDIEEKLLLSTNELQEKEEALDAAESKNSALEREISSLKKITEMRQAEPSLVPVPQEEVVVQTTVQPVASVPEQPPSDMQRENEILRQCVNETIQLREDMTQNSEFQDVEKLLELKNELETAVGALQGEIWTLNGQLKASVLDREQLQDRVVQLDTSLTEEKKKVASLDVELSEQVELTEKATRQAAEAENESNRRLDECREMESRRGELEQAYAQLTEYYNQLQAAYNQLYANVHRTNDGTQQTNPQMVQPMDPALLSVIDGIMADLQLESSPEMDIRSKINAIQLKIREKMQELEQLHSAVNEQRKVNEALEGRMGALEERAELTGGESLELKNRLNQLEGDLEWKQEECDSLRRQVDELQHALNTVIANDGDDAAKLATRQADVDSLFRTNAELAHTNVRLQNELEEREEGEERAETSGNGQDQQALVEKVKELEEKLAEWTNSKEEIDRLRGIEKVLNNRILSLEDQLLEKEEQLQAIEEELLEQRSAENSDELHKLQEANSIVMEELTSLREERDTLRRTIETMEEERENRIEEAMNQKMVNGERGEEKELKEEIERLKKERQEEKRMAKEELKQYQDELEEMQTELQVLQEKLKMKEEDQKKEKESEWGDWGEEEKEGQNEEIERLTANVEELERSLAKEREAHQEKIKEILKEKEEMEKELREEVDDAMAEAIRLTEELAETEKRNDETEKQEEWGWGEEGQEKEKEDGERKDLQEEITTLRETIDELRQKLEDSEKSEGQFRSQVAELEVQMASGQQSRESWNDGWGEEGAEEIEELRQSEAELKNQLELAQQQLNVASVELEERKREMEELNGELENYKENEQRFESMAAVSNGETEKLKQLISRLEEEKEELSQETEELRREMEGFVERELSLQQQMETLNMRLEEIEKEKEVSEKKDEGWDDNGWGEESGTSMKNELEELKRELTETKEQLGEAHQQISSLKEEIHRHKDTVALLESEVTALEEREISLQEQLEKKEKIPEQNWDDGWGDNESKEPSGKLLELEKELADTQKELQKTKEQFESEKNDVKKIKEKMEELEAEVEDHVATETRLKESLAKMEKEKENLLSIVTRTENEKDEILTEIEDLKLVIIEYSEKEKTLEKRLETTISQLTEAQAECQRLREENLRKEEEEKTKSAAEEDAWGNDGWDEEEQKKELQEELEKSQEQLSTVSQKLEEVKKILEETRKMALERENMLHRKINELEEKSTEAEEAEKLRKTLKEKENEMERLGKKLEEVMKQNNLLKESEGRLLESVDEWGEIAEKNGEESKRLQKVVNDLEKERVEMGEELARLRREMEILKEKQQEKQESTLLTNELETLREERDSLRKQLTTAEVKLAEVEKEKAAVKSSYDQLRAKITARRAAAASGPRSRPPSVASSIGEIREEPILPTSSPTPITPLSVSSPPQQAQLSAQSPADVIRRRSGYPKN